MLMQYRDSLRDRFAGLIGGYFCSRSHRLCPQLFKVTGLRKQTMQ